MTARAFPLSVRRAVLERSRGFCERCGVSCDNRPSELDHVVPYALGGKSTLANAMLLCLPCHRLKSALDLASIAKANRQRKAHTTGRSRARKGRPMQGRGFDTRFRRRMDGTTERVA